MCRCPRRGDPSNPTGSWCEWIGPASGLLRCGSFRRARFSSGFKPPCDLRGTERWQDPACTVLVRYWCGTGAVRVRCECYAGSVLLGAGPPMRASDQDRSSTGVVLLRGAGLHTGALPHELSLGFASALQYRPGTGVVLVPLTSLGLVHHEDLVSLHLTDAQARRWSTSQIAVLVWYRHAVTPSKHGDRPIVRRHPSSPVETSLSADPSSEHYRYWCGTSTDVGCLLINCVEADASSERPMGAPSRRSTNVVLAVRLRRPGTPPRAREVMRSGPRTR